MKKFHIHVSVKNASGTQTFVVEAKDANEALKRWQKHGELIDSEVEVTALEEPDIRDVHEVE